MTLALLVFTPLALLLAAILCAPEGEELDGVGFVYKRTKARRKVRAGGKFMTSDSNYDYRKYSRLTD